MGRTKTSVLAQELYERYAYDWAGDKDERLWEELTSKEHGGWEEDAKGIMNLLAT